MTNRPHNRPVLRPAAGKSLSVQDAAQLIDELQHAVELEPEQADPPLRDPLSGELVQRQDQVEEQIGNDRARQLADALGDTEEIAPEEILFGPHASLHSAEDKHLAAWEIYQALLLLESGEPVVADVEAKAKAWERIESAFIGFRDGGFDWQLDSAPLMRELQAELDSAAGAE